MISFRDFLRHLGQPIVTFLTEDLATEVFSDTGFDREKQSYYSKKKFDLGVFFVVVWKNKCLWSDLAKNPKLTTAWKIYDFACRVLLGKVQRKLRTGI